MIGLRLWQIAGWTMLHYFWIGAALGAAVLLVRRQLRPATVNVRYLFALGSLFLLSVTPAVIAIVITYNLVLLPQEVSLPMDTAAQPEAIHFEETPPPMAAMNAPAPAASIHQSAEIPQAWNSERLWAALNLAATYLPWLWVCGAPLSFALTTAGLLGAERLRRQSRPLEDAPITEMCRQLAASLKISYRVSVGICDRIAAPILLGILRPMILLPAAALAGWSPQQLEMALLHELAHVRRYDNLVNLLQRIVESLLFFQPMVWIISGWVRREREHCCDELVVARTRQPHVYAEMLVTLAEKFSQGQVGWDKHSAVPPAYPQAVSSMAERPLVGRIRRILKKEEQSMQVSRKAVALVFMCFIGLAVMIAGYCTLPIYAEDSAKTAKSNDESAEPQSTISAKKSGGNAMQIKALTYTGQVTDKLTGKPIAGATVIVRRMIVAPYEVRTIEETKHTTNADGKYTFTLPPEQLAQSHLFIEVEASHPSYATNKDHYGYSMIRRNEKLGERPFFEHVELYPAASITGTVVTPEGTPAAGVKVIGFAMPDRMDLDSHSFPETTTDAQGAFHLTLAKDTDAIFWVLPKDYSISTHVIGENRGDMGRLPLEEGNIIKGRVVDEQEKPVAGVWVNAMMLECPGVKILGRMADPLVRSALTGENGEFTLAPLPAGECMVLVGEQPGDRLHDRYPSRPLSGVFGRKKLSLKAGETIEPLKIREVPQVVIEGQYYDKQGKPQQGHQPCLLGRIDDKELGDRCDWYVAYGTMDKSGHFIIRAPKGLKEANLSFRTTEHGALRVRMTKDGPLSNECHDRGLGVLDRDIRGIEVIRYLAAILLIKPVAEDGSLLSDVKVQIEYPKGRGPQAGGGRLVYGKDVSIEKQTDGRWRTHQLLPDEEFTLTIKAEGYEPKSEKLKLPEGETKELEVRLKKKS